MSEKKGSGKIKKNVFLSVKRNSGKGLIRENSFKRTRQKKKLITKYSSTHTHVKRILLEENRITHLLMASTTKRKRTEIMALNNLQGKYT